MAEPSAGEIAILREYFSDFDDHQLIYIIRHLTDWPRFTPSTVVLPHMRLRQWCEDLMRNRQLWEQTVRDNA